MIKISKFQLIAILVFFIGCSDKELGTDSDVPKMDTLFFDSGGKIEGIYTKVNTEFEGAFKEFYRSGNISRIGKYKNSMLFDTIKEYYDVKGRILKSLGIYRHADTSKVTIINENARPMISLSYQQSYTEFYMNGRIKEHGQYSPIFFRHSSFAEKDSFIDVEGDKVITSSFVQKLQSCKEGIWQFYDSLGNKISEQNYLKGTCK
jgi:antitoxin component YwqK of YwqJK toxin-antitoxin module